MTRVKRTLCAGMLMIGISSSVLAGNIGGMRTTSAGNIGGMRTISVGNIGGTRTPGNIGGTRISSPSDFRNLTQNEESPFFATIITMFRLLLLF